MSAYYEFKLPAKILSGDGALEHIPHELDSLGAHRPLLLSDQGLEQVGTVKIVQAALRQGGMAAAETFCRIPPDSSIQVVNQIAGLYRQAQCDSLIAVGGGSVIDTAKGVGRSSPGGPMSPLWRCPPPRAPAARPPWWLWWPTRRSR